MNMFYLLSIVLGVSGQEITKKAYNNRKGGVYLFSSLSTFFALVFFVATAGNLQWNVRLVPYALAFAVAYGMATVFSVIAISCGSLSLTTLITSYSLMLPTLYGLVFLQEPVGKGFVPGMALLFISLLLINEKSESVPITPKWIVSVLLAFVGNGFCSIIQKMQQIAFNNAYKNEFMILALVMVTAAFAAIMFRTERGQIVRSVRCGWWLCLLCGIMNGAVNLFVMILSGKMAVSIMFPVISAGGIIVTALVAMGVYREHLTRKQLTGLLLGVATVVLLSI